MCLTAFVSFDQGEQLAENLAEITAVNFVYQKNVIAMGVINGPAAKLEKNSVTACEPAGFSRSVSLNEIFVGVGRMELDSGNTAGVGGPDAGIRQPAGEERFAHPGWSLQNQIFFAGQRRQPIAELVRVGKGAGEGVSDCPRGRHRSLQHHLHTRCARKRIGTRRVPTIYYNTTIMPGPPPTASDLSAVAVDVVRVGADTHTGTDLLAVEEPLEIRLGFGPTNNRFRRTACITMRTPGHDTELAVGFLFAEGILETAADLLAAESTERNVVRVELQPSVTVDLARLERHFYTTSSCGLCGKTSLEAVERRCDSLPAGQPVISAAVIHDLPQRLRYAQPTFERTGGLHAAALFDADGNLLTACEDVGRHNAVDKLLGRKFLQGSLPLHRCLLFVSGRAGFELVQKAAAAGVPVFAAVGAPSSLAADLARRVGMTLLGFVRDGRFNVYTGAQRIAL